MGWSVFAALALGFTNCFDLLTYDEEHVQSNQLSAGFCWFWQVDKLKSQKARLCFLLDTFEFDTFSKVCELVNAGQAKFCDPHVALFAIKTGAVSKDAVVGGLTLDPPTSTRTKPSSKRKSRPRRKLKFKVNPARTM